MIDKEVVYGAPVYAPKRVQGLFELPHKIHRDLIGMYGPSKENFDSVATVTKLGKLDYIEAYYVSGVADELKKTLLQEAKFTKDIELLFKALLFFTISHKTSIIETIQKKLGELIVHFSSEPLYIEKFYRIATSYLDQSQLIKLQEAYLGGASLREIGLEQQKLFLFKLIGLFAAPDHSAMINKNDSTSFLGLDKSAKEAVCWSELEFSRSQNREFARLAGIIAWRSWLFKEPILKEFCSQNNIDYAKLNFAQKAQLLEKAVKYFSSEQMTMLIDEAVESELEKRKTSLVPETNPKFLNKRASMGLELEIGRPPFATAVNYAWHENLDRSTYGDRVKYHEEIRHAFEYLVSLQDQKDTVSLFQSLLENTNDAVELFSKKNLDAQDSELVSQLVAKAVDGVLDKSMKQNLQKWLAEKPLTLEYLMLIKKYWLTKLSSARTTLLETKNTFDSLFLKWEKKESVYEETSEYFKNLDETVFSNFARQMLDLFRHHMGQIQALGHKIGSDAYGEYQLTYTSGNFKNPYRLNIREIWELAKTGFHDLDVKSRPIHVTVGWQEDLLDRSVVVEKEIVEEQASILNFALLATGHANPGFIEEVEQKNQELLASEGRPVKIVSHDDTGKGSMIIARELRGADRKLNIFAVEFRGFSPGGDRNQVRLLDSLGELATAMKAYIFIKSMSEEKPPRKGDIIDDKLAAVWLRFSSKVKKIHQQYGDIPSLTDSSEWILDEDHFNDESDVKKITRFYLRLIKEKKKKNGLVRQMRELIANTIQVVNSILDG